jgi:hemerythrin
MSHPPVPPDPHAVCAAVRQARKNLCHRIELTACAEDVRFVHEFPALVSEVEAGFRREELVMELLGFPHLRERREENAVILSALHRVVPAVEYGNLAIGREVVAALRDLLDLHRLTADLALAVAVRPTPGRDHVQPAWQARPSGLHRRHVI